MTDGTTAGLALAFTLACPTLAPAPAEATPLRISELLYDAVGSDDGRVFVELFGTAGISLEGLSLEGVNGSGGAVGPVLALSGTVPADGFFVVADGAAGVSEVSEFDLLLNFDFQNGPDSVVLRAADGSVLDALGYGAFGVGDVFAGEGAAAPDAAAGESLARRFADVDTGDNAADFLVLAAPTPGGGPLLVPEPETAALFVAGLCGCACLRRLRRRPPWTDA
jgi:hypothetical protein